MVAKISRSRGLLLSVAAFLLLLTAPLLAQEQTMIVVPLNGPVQVGGTVVPLSVQLTNPQNEEVPGFVRIEVGMTRYERPVTVPANGAANVLMMVAVPTELTEGEQAVNLMPVWLTQSGQRIARTTVILALDNVVASATSDDPSDASGIMLLSINAADRRDYDPVRANATLLATQLQEALGVPVTDHAITAEEFPFMAAAFQSTVVFRLFGDVETLDIPARNALLERVRAGAVLLIDAPPASINTSFLADVLPARVVGTRMSDQAGSEPLAEMVEISELAPAVGSTVELADDGFAHAVSRPLGRGRIAMISFPVIATPEDSDMFRNILAPGVQQVMQGSQPSGPQRENILRSMVGLEAPAWRSAAGFAGGYVLLLGITLLAVPTVWRPVAFVGAGVLAIGMAIGLTLMGSSDEDNQLSTAELRIIDLSAEGSGVQEAWSVAFGVDDQLRLRTDGLLSLITDRAATEATVTMFPATAIAPVQAKAMPVIWHAAGPFNLNVPATAVLRLSDGPFTISLPTLPIGPLNHAVMAGDPGQFVQLSAPDEQDARTPLPSGGGLLDAPARLRREVIDSALASDGVSTSLASASRPTQLMAFATEAPPAIVSEATNAASRTMTLLRLPLRLEPPAAGAAVRLTGPLVRVVSTMALPRSPVSGEWNVSNVPGTLVVGLQPAELVSGTAVQQADITLDISASEYKVTLRPAMLDDEGVPVPMMVGQELASVDGALGQMQATLNVTDANRTADGTAWFTLSIQPLEGSVGGSWQIRSLEAELSGTYQPQSSR